MSERSLVFDALEKRGQIAPIILPPEVTKGTGLFNPSVLIDPFTILKRISLSMSMVHWFI